METADLLKPPALSEIRRALVIQPHPDDNEIGMGGTVAKLVQDGAEVIYLTVTNGDRGCSDPNLTLEDIAAIRRKETEAAGRCLGVERFYYLNLPDGGPLDLYDTAVKIAGVIREVKPDTVFCPDPWLPYEAHADHRDTGLAATQAVMNAGLRDFPRGAVYEKHAPANIGYYFTAYPNTVADVSDTFEKKFDAILCHKSQVDEQTAALFRMYFTGKAQELAEGQPFALGEGLKMLRKLHMHCFVDAVRI